MLQGGIAARELHVQRSTLLYRLERIREIAHIDLNKAEPLLDVAPSLHIVAKESQDKPAHPSLTDNAPHTHSCAFAGIMAASSNRGKGLYHGDLGLSDLRL